MKTITKSADLGKGWSADRFTDHSMDVKNKAQRQLIELAPASVSLLRNILNNAGKAA